MPITVNNNSHQTDAAVTARIVTLGCGFDRKSLLGRVSALAARCAP
jgi:hypothetical protein